MTECLRAFHPFGIYLEKHNRIWYIAVFLAEIWTNFIFQKVECGEMMISSHLEFTSNQKVLFEQF